MIDTKKSVKPRAVLRAERALWIWTLWASLFGIYQTWQSVSELTGQMEGALEINPQALFRGAAVGYVVLALASVWVIFKIGAGKRWARSSLLWGFILEVLWTFFPPYREILDYAPDLPDFVFQTYALYLLYTKPGSDWFSLKTA